MIRLSGKIRIDKHDLAFAEERLHGIVSYLQCESALPWYVSFKQRFSMDEARRLLARNHLIDLIPSQKWHLPHWAEWRGMGAFCEVEQPFRVRRTAESQRVSMNAKMPGECFPDRRVLREVI